MKFDYCETYGNHTVKYFQDFRSSVLNSSKSNFCKGGYFPTFYSYNPDLATEARNRKWDRWLQVPAYSLSNTDHDRREELIRFDKVILTHLIFFIRLHVMKIRSIFTVKLIYCAYFLVYKLNFFNLHIS